LQKRREAADMIDMTVGDHDSVNVPEQIASIPEQMDTRFPGIDKQMHSVKMQQVA
jgi:hypothetical protein